ncbi:hypothetical protein scyTo_0018715 [Scyliorhinus torazame]|uniref:VLIG-type G domain-containing protein n=2 Tax=Scyliorhinus torazame TaxID=75743 RepID=A0A401Q1A0_SCYTO|nr:hypothetical protein [Scyliorhinus torazame]
MNDMLKEREKLLKVPETCSLLGASMSPREQTDSFVSHTHAVNSKQCMEQLGLSLTNTLEIGFCGFKLDVKGEYSTSSSNSTSTSTDSTYVSLCKMVIVPMASVELNIKDLTLSESAVNSLKDVESNLRYQESEDTKDASCQQFLERYGSHVSCSNIQFGGIYLTEAASDKLKHKEREGCEEVMKTLINTDLHIGGLGSVNASVSTSASHFKSNINYTCSKSLLEKIRVSITKIGGPVEASSRADWMAGLQAQNSTWRVIDRGSVDNLVPVWKVILNNHRSIFEDHQLLTENLQRCWERKTGLKSEDAETSEVIDVNTGVQDLVQEVNKWITVSELDFLTNCVRNVSQCLDIKSSLRKHFTIDTDRLWYHEFICKSSVQVFIGKVLQCVAEQDLEDVDKVYLKICLSDLLQPQGMIRSLDFPSLPSVFQQLSDIPNNKEEFTFCSVEEAKEHIRKLERRLEGLEVGNEFQTKICNELGKALFNLQLLYKQSGDKYTSILLTALLHPVSYEASGILNQPLTDNDRKYLISQLNVIETYRSEMKTMEVTQRQAFLLYKALTAGVTETQNKDPRTVLQTMCAEMEQEMTPRVREAVMTPSGTFLSNMEHLKVTLLNLSEDKDSQEEKAPSVVGESLVRSTHRDQTENTINTHSDSPSDCTERLNNSHNDRPPQIVNDLGLQNYYPHKLSLNFMREICWDKLKNNKPTQLIDVPWHFLQRILSANSIARNPEWPPAQQSEGQTETEEDISDFFEEVETKISGINPLDITAAVFLCADYFLQQELMLKMSLCQFALPFLQPVGNTAEKKNDTTDGSGATLSLWAMRSIVKKWCPESLRSSNGFKEMPIVTAAMPTISFIRLGRSTISKSKILNLTLSQTQLQQNIFLHSEMVCGNVPRGISDGLAEISWYLPSGKRNLDIFPEAAAFINLRGNAETNQRNTQFLAKVSTALFIFIDVIGEKEKKFLTSLAQFPAKFFLIINSNSNQQNITREQTKKLFNDLKLNQQCIVRTNINDAKLVENMCSKIKHMIQTREENATFLNLEQMANIARESGIHVDEDHPKIQRGKQQASGILGGLNNGNIHQYKGRVLPFHGKPWQEWSQAEKEKSRMKLRGDKSTEEYKYELDQKKETIRQAQRKKELSEELREFIRVLTSTSGDERAFFLRWLRLNLDNKSRELMSKLRSRYKELSKVSKQKANELKRLDQQMSDSSLGLEHFMRELGQVYEVSMMTGNTRAKREVDSNILRLPDVAAELLLDGFPLELIDGDVSNIPVQWVTAVMNKVAKKVRTRSRLFVVTVIGVQSTGKSTLLNTMFGLQFAVSSGRCTRGAFMQFIKVRGSLAKDLGCDFILVIDTEGLKAPELATLTDSYEHDNELATFVIGLSNLTLVNMGMENPTEMKDILQIVVHSLIRMKQTGKGPICQFVHQNVGDVCAHDQNLRGRQKLLEQLDQMTEAAAKLEKLDQVKFSDVMEYDPDKSNWYIPGLWHGTPPMAAVNTGYSEHVFDLKTCLINSLLERSKSERALTIPDFIKWMSGLWEQVKNENFIFSFQNSLVAEAYSQLSMKYKDWEWELRKFAHSWATQAENRINNESEVNTLLSELELEIRKDMGNKKDETLEKLKVLFESGADNVQLMERYKEQFKLSISTLCVQLQDNSIQKCRDTLNRRAGLQKVDAIWNECNEQIEEQVKQLLQNCKEVQQVLDDEELKTAFEGMWRDTLSKLNHQPCTERNIEVEIENLLREDTEAQGRVINESLQRNPLSKLGTKWFQVVEKHIDLFKMTKFMRLGSSVQQSDLDRAFLISKSLESECRQYIDNITKMDVDYDNKDCIEILNYMEEKINRISDSKFKMSEIFRAEFKLHMCGFAAPRFSEMQTKFINKHDPRKRLESKKDQYFELFMGIYKEQDQN